MRFSPSKSQFYPDDFGYQKDAIPEDVIEVPQEDFVAALERRPDQLLAVKKGRVIVVPAPEVDLVERAEAFERFWRLQQLGLTDVLVTRHRDELEEGLKVTTLSLEQYTALQAYRRALRRWPEADQFPLVEHRPTPPEWLKSLPQ
ncbi:phage tail protein [Pseudomonas protegens]|uniref:phage tail protein n=1 Tax=Pseudomonas protegens TaxID=380021 RepID=UPI00383A8A05